MKCPRYIDIKIDIFCLGEDTITVAPFAGSAMISPLDDEKTRNEDTVQIMLAEQGRGLQLLQEEIFK